MLAVAWLCALAVALPPEPAPVALAEYRARREKLRARLGDDDVAVVFAARDADPFRQDRNFLYLTGLDVPGAALVLAGGKGDDTETLYLPARDRAEERWSGAQPGPGDIDPETGGNDAERKKTIESTGVAGVAALPTLDVTLVRHLQRGRTLWLAAEPRERDQPETPALHWWNDLALRAPGGTLRSLNPALAAARAVKSAAEVAAIEHAVAITLEAEREVAARIEPGLHEYQVKAVLEYVFTHAGAGLAFPSIVGSGPNSTVLHYRDDRRTMAAGELVVVDIGAEWQGYAADVTRTWPVSGHFTPEQRQVYELVLRAQEAALARVKPGARLRSDVHAAAKAVIAEAGDKDFFPHGTSHYVGLDVHDVGERDGKLEAGMVITVEPGVYLPAKGFGVRIEDMVLVTATGHRLLTAALPRSVDAIEALMAKPAAAPLP